MLGLVEVRNILQSIASQTDSQGVSEWVSVCVCGGSRECRVVPQQQRIPHTTGHQRAHACFVEASEKTLPSWRTFTDLFRTSQVK